MTLHPDADLSYNRNVYVLYCKDIHVAARYAAERSWWLHSWKFLTDEFAPIEPQEFRLKGYVPESNPV